MEITAGFDRWLAAILDAVADGVTAQDRAGRVLYANEAAARLMGFPSVEALLSSSTDEYLRQFEIFDEQGNPFSLDQLPGRQVLLGKMPPPMTLCFRNKTTGEERWIEVKARPVSRDDIPGIIAVNLFHNVTALKQAEQQLRRREEELRDFVENAVIGMHWADAQGRILWANQAELDLLGYSREEYVGHHVFEFHADADVYREMLRRLRKNEALQGFEARLRCKDGSIRHVLIDSNVAWEDGRFLHTRCFTRDITLRKMAEQALEQNKQRLQAIFDNVRDAILIADGEGRYVDTNPAACDLTGYTREELLQLKVTDITAAANELTAADAWNAFGSSGSQSGECVLIRKDGTPVVAEYRAVANVMPGLHLSVLRDISARKQSELALARERRLMRLLIDNLPDFVFVKDRDSRFLMTNNAHARVLGVDTAEGAFGRTDFDFFPRPFADKYYQDEQEIIRTGRAKVDMEEPATTVDGQPITVLTTKIPLRDETGEIIGILGVSRDITERKRAAERTRLLYRMTAALSQALTYDDVIAVIGQKAFPMLGGAFGALLLLSPDGQYLDPVFHHNLPEVITAAYDRVPITLSAPMTDAVRSGEPVWIESAGEYRERYPHLFERLQAHTGARSIVCLPLFVAGRAIGGIGTTFREQRTFGPEDRTYMEAIAWQCAQALERARLYELEREARVEAERANAVKLQFLGMISHELRTPLASIKGFSSTLLADDVDFEPAVQRDFMRIIDAEADKLTELVSQLLDLSRLHAGSLTVKMRPVRLHDVIEQGQRQLERLAHQHQLRIELPDNLPSVMADPERVMQVLYNLVGNAAKYSPAESEIRVSAWQDGHWVQIDVHDRGAGIPPEQREAVFEAFKQLDHDRGGRQGAGLGLAICKGLIESHGGGIWVQDHPGPGTIVSFTLPVVVSPGSVSEVVDTERRG